MTAGTDGPILACVLPTPAGPLSLLAGDGALVAAGFTADPGRMHARLHPCLRARPMAAARARDLPWLITPVRQYFDGDLRALDGLPVHQPAAGGRQRLWAELRQVSAGTTVSYTELARRAGNARAARAAGAACAANLVAPVIPCHRVLRADGGLGGYYYGLARKEWLLRHEGARRP